MLTQNRLFLLGWSHRGQGIRQCGHTNILTPTGNSPSGFVDQMLYG